MYIFWRKISYKGDYFQFVIFGRMILKVLERIRNEKPRGFLLYGYKRFTKNPTVGFGEKRITPAV